ncbi:MAG: DUF2877 domain-containing protein [Alphaproteobacteria bacterium]|nr:DUF2877 domain-containing protein [Alphaproteobacteria bacterium]
MRFVASEMPPLSAPTTDGRVHSVFRRVVNLRLADGDLLTLYAGDDDRQPPGAISFAPPADFDFSEHVVPNAAISFRGGILRIAGTGISIDLRQARRNAADTARPLSSGTTTEFNASWHLAWDTLIRAAGSAGLVIALHGRRPAGAFDAALAARAQQAVPHLLDAARSNHIAAAMNAARQLAGAGPGLTPSGDDFLAGFLVGARHVAQTKTQFAFLDRLGQALSSPSHNSGDIAGAYLIHAAAGRAARPLRKLAFLVSQGGRASDIETATITALHVGHSSGADGTFGLLCGLAAWRPEFTATITAGLTPGPKQ